MYELLTGFEKLFLIKNTDIKYVTFGGDMKMESLIGNTPMIKINYEYNGKAGSIYSKLEYYNYTGSIKERIALYILEKEKAYGNLAEGQSIVEVTSGNTGISFSAIGALLGHEVHIFMPDWVSMERKKSY